MSEEETTTTPVETVTATTGTITIETEPTFTQEQVNALLAKERSQVTRKVKKAYDAKQAPPQTQELPSSAVQQDEPPSWAASLIADVGDIKANREQEKSDNSFAQEVSGLELDENKRKSLKLSHQHDPELFAVEVAGMKAQQLPPKATGEPFTGIGAPAPVASSEMDENPNSWDADQIARYRAEGTFLPRIKKYETTLPGGAGGLFPAKNHSKG